MVLLGINAVEIQMPCYHKWVWGNSHCEYKTVLLSGEPDYFGRNKISSGGDLSHYSSASLD